MSLFSVSSGYRVEQCGASVALAPVIEGGEWAEQGNEGHLFMDNTIELYDHLGDIGKARRDILDWMEENKYEHVDEWAKIDLQKMFGDITHPVTEVAFAINVVTGEARYLGHHLERQYPKLSDEWVVGSEDLIAFKPGHGNGPDLMVARDWKNGDHVGPVEDNLQVGFHAYATWKLTGMEVEGGIGYLRDNTLETHHFSELDHEITLGRLRKARRNALAARESVAKGQVPPVFPGEWCKYCPAQYACPKWTGLVKAFGEEPSRAITIDDVARLWPKFREYKAMFDTAEKQFKGLVKNSPDPIVLENGKVLKMVPSTRDYVDGKRALALLKQYGASDDEIESCLKVTHFERMMEKNK